MLIFQLSEYTSAGRRTSSMSGVDISKTAQKSDLSKLPQPADLRVPFDSNPKLKEKIVEEDWTILQLQNGLETSESSSYELINNSDVDDELEQVLSKINLTKNSKNLCLDQKHIFFFSES